MSGIDKNRSRLLTALMIPLLLGGCHLFENLTEMENIVMKFNETNVEIAEGGLGSLSLTVHPVEVLESYEVEYHVSNENVSTIYRADKRGVVFLGKGIGSCVITAKIRDAEAKAVISVRKLAY